MQITNKIAFGRALRKDEIPEYRRVVQEGFDYLGKEKVTLIVPQPAFPSKQGDDTGIGSPYTDGGKEFTKDIAQWGFNGIQFLPGGKLNGVDPVPYVSTVFSGNDLFINLQELILPKWGKILPVEIYKNIVENKPHQEKISLLKNYDPKCNTYVEHTLSGDNISYYQYATEASDKALRIAYDNFTDKGEFKAFCENPDNAYWLEKDAVYEALSKLHGDVYYKKWNSDIDKNLFDRSIVSEEQARKRLSEIHSDPKLEKEIAFYKFKQFILYKQNKDFQTYSRDIGIKAIADVQSGIGDRDKWGHPEAFIKGLNLNCPPNIWWGMPVLNPQKFYNPDKTLGESGKFLYLKFG